MSFFGNGKSQQRQAHTDKDFVAIANFPRRSGDH
jgi:hypothetical protein